MYSKGSFMPYIDWPILVSVYVCTGLCLRFYHDTTKRTRI